MEAFKIGILEGKDFSEDALASLKELGEVSIFHEGMELDSFLRDKNALFVRLAYMLDSSFLKKCKQLQYICSPTTGLNHIDLNYVSVNGIHIVSLKGEEQFLSTIRATPEHIFGLAIALLRNYSTAFIQDVSLWDRDKFIGEELFQNKIGIIGYGRVGKLLAKYFQSFEAQVFVYEIDEYKPVENALRLNRMVDVIQESNIVILTASYNESNQNMISAPVIELMKGKYFINAARGELVDEAYLLEKIQDSHFKGVAIDVVSNEVKNQHYIVKLLEATRGKNVIVTPHIGGATFNSMRRTEEYIVKKLSNLIAT